jgi:hypothetical protein
MGRFKFLDEVATSRDLLGTFSVSFLNPGKRLKNFFVNVI